MPAQDFIDDVLVTNRSPEVCVLVMRSGAKQITKRCLVVRCFSRGYEELNKC